MFCGDKSAYRRSDKSDELSDTNINKFDKFTWPLLFIHYNYIALNILFIHEAKELLCLESFENFWDIYKGKKACGIRQSQDILKARE